MRQAKAKRIGRTKLSKGLAKSRVLDLRLTNEEDRKFTLAARANRKTVPAWIRSVLNAELEILVQKADRDGQAAPMRKTGASV